ncbi:MAG: hypothetical protein IT480_03225 [Gammaproteobacteria bacterium]|nr:hypothetical protein [Gammaproteobacteria bacterium]
MSQRNPIRVFVTHVWQECDDYLRVFEYLESARNFYYANLSRPGQVPAGAGNEALREELRRQMGPAEVVIALLSLAGTQRDTFMFQLNYAKAMDKPVVLLPGFGRDLPVPKDVSALIDETVRWDERSLVDAVRRQARHEDTTRWDTIEFKMD